VLINLLHSHRDRWRSLKASIQQTEKECLVFVFFAVQKFHNYLYGKGFDCLTLNSFVLKYFGQKDVINHIRLCLPYQAVILSCSPEPLKPSTLPTAPWCEIFTDFHGPLPFDEKLLVILDEYSRFPVVHIMRNTTTDHIRRNFRVIRLPRHHEKRQWPTLRLKQIKDYMIDASIHHRKIT